jgi:hypothetical protein
VGMVGLFRTTACTTAVAEVEGGMHGGSGGWEWERDWGRSLCVRVKDEKEGSEIVTHCHCLVSIAQLWYSAQV